MQDFSRFAGIGWPCLRFNKTGWEIVVGPILCGTKRSKGFFDESDNWVRLEEWKKSNPGQPDPDNTTKMLDTKGEFGLENMAAAESTEPHKRNLLVEEMLSMMRDHTFVELVPQADPDWEGIESEEKYFK